MSAGWDRVETTTHGVDLADGLAARIADPLWMLARQRQVGEFRGDDAAQPVAIRVRGRFARLATYRPGPASAARPVTAFPTGMPLETVVEATEEPGFGSAGLYASARAGARLIRALRSAAVPAAAVAALRAAFPLAVAGDLGAAGEPAARALSTWSLDGRALGAATAAQLDAALAGLDAAGRRSVQDTVASWRSRYAGSAPGAGGSSWDDDKLAYSFSLGVATDAGELVLTASDYAGGRLDWYACDLDGVSHGLDPAPTAPIGVTALPAPVRYPGMPASRWWEFEDGAVNFGGVSAGPADLARLAVTEFAIVYDDDWFLVPVRIPVGTLTELDDVEVYDTFGGRTPVPSVAWSDAARVGAARNWRLYELAGDAVAAGHPAPWLYLAPTVASSLDGPVLERVTLTRDEAANLAWGVEHLIEGPLGRAVSRAETWRLPTAAPGEASVADATASVDGEISTMDGAVSTMDDAWHYRLGGEAPPWWIPFVPERAGGHAVPDGAAQIRFRRSRLASWAELAAPDQAGPRSQLLDPHVPRRLYEHQVPAGGVRVERAWQVARWTDGSMHLWLQRRVRPGGGDRGTGLRYDIIDNGT